MVLALSFMLVTNISVAQCGGKTAKAKSDCSSKTAKSECSSETAKIAFVKFHADYCGACVKLEPKITELKGKFKDDVYFVKFDFSSDDAKAKTKSLAADNGLQSVLDAHKGTGYVVLYDLKSKKVVGKLKNSHSVAEMESKLKTFL